MTGLFCGVGFTLFILLGSLAFPKLEVYKDTSTAGCIFSTNSTIIQPSRIYETEGILKLFHITFLLVPIIGFVISFLIGLSASLLAGNSNINYKHPRALPVRSSYKI